MKLRYYLRGLAVGILLTTVILAIANAGNRPLTDAEIRQRALALGMIESDSVKLSSLQQEESEPAESGADGGGESGAVGTEESSAETAGSTEESSAETEGSTEESSAETEGSTEESSAEITGGTEASSGERAPGESSSQTAAEEPLSPDVQPVTFRISSGANSYTVSKELAALGLVEDAAAFDTFLCDNGYSKKIRVGTYEILPGTSEEEIAKMISR